MKRTDILSLAIVTLIPLALVGCAELASSLPGDSFVTAPKAKAVRPQRAVHRTFVKPAAKHRAVRPAAASVAESAAVKCRKALYVDKAGSAEEMKAREAACRSTIVDAPIGAAN